MKTKRTKQIVGMVIGGILLLLSPVVARTQYAIGIERVRAKYERYYHEKGPSIDDRPLRDAANMMLYAFIGGLVCGIAGLMIGAASVDSFVRAGRAEQHPRNVPQPDSPN
jgi:hypothetical protein